MIFVGSRLYLSSHISSITTEICEMSAQSKKGCAE